MLGCLAAGIGVALRAVPAPAHLVEDNGSFTEFQPCVTPASDIDDRGVRTIEGLADMTSSTPYSRPGWRWTYHSVGSASPVRS